MNTQYTTFTKNEVKLLRNRVVNLEKRLKLKQHQLIQLKEPNTIRNNLQSGQNNQFSGKVIEQNQYHWDIGTKEVDTLSYTNQYTLRAPQPQNTSIETQLIQQTQTTEKPKISISTQTQQPTLKFPNLLLLNLQRKHAILQLSMRQRTVQFDKKLQSMRQKLKQQKEQKAQTIERIHILKEENLQLKQHILSLEESLEQIQRENQLESKLKQYQDLQRENFYFNNRLPQKKDHLLWISAQFSLTNFISKSMSKNSKPSKIASTHNIKIDPVMKYTKSNSRQSTLKLHSKLIQISQHQNILTKSPVNKHTTHNLSTHNDISPGDKIYTKDYAKPSHSSSERLLNRLNPKNTSSKIFQLRVQNILNKQQSFDKHMAMQVPNIITDINQSANTLRQSTFINKQRPLSSHSQSRLNMPYQLVSQDNKRIKQTDNIYTSSRQRANSGYNSHSQPQQNIYALSLVEKHPLSYNYEGENTLKYSSICQYKIHDFQSKNHQTPISICQQPQPRTRQKECNHTEKRSNPSHQFNHNDQNITPPSKPLKESPLQPTTKPPRSLSIRDLIVEKCVQKLSLR